MFHVENEEQFKDFVKGHKVLVDFYATWCGPCKMLSPILEELEESNELNMPIIKVDVDKISKVASLYQIQSIPTLMIFENGKPIKRSIGFMNKNQLLEFVK